MILNDKFCTKCGRYLENNRRYCPECGMPQFMVRASELSKTKCFILFTISTMISTVVSLIFINLNIYIALLLIPLIIVLGRRKTVFGIVISGVLLGILLGFSAGSIHRIFSIATGVHF
ncbi:MAG: zinc ribbon domain-containing protein [archaeon]|nr:zinc ribbon domain-containing protein [archaeon]